MQEKKIFVRTNDIPSLKRVNRKFHVAVDRATTAAKKVYIYIYIYISVLHAQSCCFANFT